jgi:hypothetical protein
MGAPLTTYPGTVTPLRGLAPFVETERDVFFGRDAERDALTRLITQDGVRAGLLFGEPGVGKTSLLRAGVAPHLRDHGVVALACEDFAAPTDGFARALATASAIPVRPGEKSVDYIVRVVSGAMQGQLYVFVVDDVDVALRADIDGRVAIELADLFQRVTTRSSGRARFLFGVADIRQHWLDALERRTGSLFPPVSRYRLTRFTREQALDVIDRTLALAGLGTDPALAGAVTEGLLRASGGAVLPADVQLAARALRDLRVTSAAALAAMGGAGELWRRWALQAAGDAGHERHGLRLLGELAAADEPVALTAADAAVRAGVPAAAAERGLAAFAGRGLCVSVNLPEGSAYALAHELLVPRLRELAAPAREGAERARALLAEAAAGQRRLGPRELEELAREGVAPATTAEARALDARRRRLITIAAAAVAAPIALLVVMYVSMSGRYYLSTAGEGSARRVVVREGRPGLSAFHWLGFGDVVADSGFSAGMISPEAWKKVRGHDLGGPLGETKNGRAHAVAASLGTLRPPLGALVRYAAGEEKALGEARKAATTPEETVALLELLRPIARGGDEEVAMVSELAGDPSPAVKRAALRVALDTARRRPGAYKALLGAAMASPDAELRTLALAGVHGLGADTEGALLGEALGKAPSAAVRRDLLAAFAALPSVSPATSAGVAAAMLGGEGGAKLEPADAEDAWRMLETALGKDPAAGTRAAATLLADQSAAPAVRARALKLLADRAPADALKDVSSEIEAAVLANEPELAAAALPLYARVAPEEAARKLVGFTDPPPALRVAIAGAWGELAKSRPDAAAASLEPLLDDKSAAVRAAAARAYGKLGRVAQARLVTICKTQGGDLAEGAAWGLAASVEAGGSSAEAAAGIGQLWKKKGGAKRDAAKVYAHLCKVKPAAFVDYCASAARDADDRALNPIGVDGLCNAVEAGAAKVAAAGLRAAAESESPEARRRVAACVAAHPAELGETGLKIALRYSEEADAELRLDAARALAGMVKEKKAGKPVVGALGKLLGDADRRVRLAAAQGLARLETIPREAVPTLGVAWNRADESEKLLLVDVARAAGAGDTLALAARDAAPAVRARALGAAAASPDLAKDLPQLLGAALMDADPAVRSEALRLVSVPGSGVSTGDAVKSLELAATGDDPGAVEAALTALAGLDDPARAAERLGFELRQPSDARRARAARAAYALARRDGAAAQKLLEPALADPSHDVRAAAVVSLAAAYAASEGPDKLAERLRKAEKNALMRLCALHALVELARGDGADAARGALDKLKTSGPPFARFFAELGLSLLDSNADAPAFLAALVP